MQKRQSADTNVLMGRYRLLASADISASLVHSLSNTHGFCLSQKADLLNFATHSAYVLDMRMAKTPDKVSTFLRDLEQRLQTLKQREMDIFLKYKKEDVRRCTQIWFYLLTLSPLSSHSMGSPDSELPDTTLFVIVFS